MAGAESECPHHPRPRRNWQVQSGREHPGAFQEGSKHSTSMTSSHAGTRAEAAAGLDLLRHINTRDASCGSASGGQRKEQAWPAPGVWLSDGGASALPGQLPRREVSPLLCSVSRGVLPKHRFGTAALEPPRRLRQAESWRGWEPEAADSLPDPGLLRTAPTPPPRSRQTQPPRLRPRAGNEPHSTRTGAGFGTA